MVEARNGIPEDELGSLYDSSTFLLKFGYGEHGARDYRHRGDAAHSPRDNKRRARHLRPDKGERRWPRGGRSRPQGHSEFLDKTDDGEYARLQGGLGRLQKKYSWENHAKN